MAVIIFPLRDRVITDRGRAAMADRETMAETARTDLHRKPITGSSSL